MITFAEHAVFTRRITELLTDEEYADFQAHLAENPHAGDAIPGMSGLRKIRLALPGRGKRGGARVLSLLFLRAETVFLLYVFTKGEFEDLPPDKRRVIKTLVEEIKKEFDR
jgi:hypothetical protein